MAPQDRYGFPEYVPVGVRRARAEKKAAQAKKRGDIWEPVAPLGRGRTIARTAWGKTWCTHIESFHDFSNRLPRGRTYTRNGSIVDLAIRRGKISGRVVGSEIYEQTITVKNCSAADWKTIVKRCSGKIGSLVELLEGRFSDAVMEEIVTVDNGLLPDFRQVTLQCSCPDWATLCKHLAAVLYGVGVRLDERPELLFELRGVDPSDLVAQATTGLSTQRKRSEASRALDVDLGDIFGIDVDLESSTVAKPKSQPVAKSPRRKKKPAKAAAKRSPTTSRRELLDAGVPAGTIATWLANGTLLKTDERGTYRHTRTSRARLRDYK
ncbi:MAG: SWIM zinc finger family protein [Planctomycetota bacterium]